MEVFAGLWYSSKQAVQSSILIRAVISFTCTLLLPHQKPNVMPAAKQPSVWTQQKHNPVLPPWSGAGTPWSSWEISAVRGTRCAWGGSSTHISAQSISLIPQTELAITRECIFHCDIMKLIDFQSFT